MFGQFFRLSELTNSQKDVKRSVLMIHGQVKNCSPQSGEIRHFTSFSPIFLPVSPKIRALQPLRKLLFPLAK